MVMSWHETKQPRKLTNLKTFKRMEREEGDGGWGERKVKIGRGRRDLMGVGKVPMVNK